jgi:hypothetical protein
MVNKIIYVLNSEFLSVTLIEIRTLLEVYDKDYIGLEAKFIFQYSVWLNNDLYIEYDWKTIYILTNIGSKKKKINSTIFDQAEKYLSTDIHNVIRKIRCIIVFNPAFLNVNYNFIPYYASIEELIIKHCLSVYKLSGKNILLNFLIKKPIYFFNPKASQNITNNIIVTTSGLNKLLVFLYLYIKKTYAYFLVI